MYLVGDFGKQPITLGTIVLKETGMYVAKRSPSGTWLWAVLSAGSGSSVPSNDVLGLAVDGAGGVCITGYSQGSATFGNLAVTGSGAFVAKLDASTGAWLWVVRPGGTGSNQGTDLALDGSGNIYVTGNFCDNTIRFGSSVLTKTANSLATTTDTYVAKLDPSGNWLWGTALGGTGADNSTSLTVDASGSVLVTGYFASPTLTVGTYALNNAGGTAKSTDIFVAKFNPAGVCQWAAQAGSLDNDQAYGIGLDAAGTAYLTGTCGESTLFGTLTPIYGGILVAKISTAGT